MRTRIFDPTRREVLAGLGAGLGASVAGLMAGGAVPAVTAQLALQARTATLALRRGANPQRAPPSARLRQGGRRWLGGGASRPHPSGSWPPSATSGMSVSNVA